MTEFLGNAEKGLEFYLKAHKIYTSLAQTTLDAADCAFKIGECGLSQI